MIKISWLTLNIVLFLWKTKTVLLLKSQSRLCEAKDLPCNPENPDNCIMKYYKLNSTECKNMTFNQKPQSQFSQSEESNLLGDVELNSYLYNILTYKSTAFNLTFSNIKWKHLKFRFRQVGNDMKNTCREFYVSPNAVVNDFFFDCIWSDETYEGKPFFFEYKASNNSVKIYRKFSFQVPFAKNIDEKCTQVKDWETFTYVEALTVSNGLAPNKFFLYWKPLPKIFSVQDFNISVISKDSGSEELIYNEIARCSNKNLCSFEYTKWHGTVRFGVQPICSGNASCTTAFTLFYQVGGERAKPLLIGIICVTFILPILLYVLWLIRKYVTVKERLLIKASPRVLVIYSSSAPSHANVVLNFVEYLKNHCNVEPLVDELHIFSSKSKDPFKWCNESFKKADLVMVMASPYFGYSKPSTSIYRNTDLLLLRLLRERLGTCRNKTKYFVLMMPYSQERDIPSEAENLRRFYFPRDLNKILRFVHGNRLVPNFLGCELQGGKREYQTHGRALNRAIAEAEKNLKNRNDVEMMAEECVDSEHKLLTLKKRDYPLGNYGALTDKERYKELAKEIFDECPGPLEGINLLGEEEMEVEVKVAAEEKRNELFDINELKL